MTSILELLKKIWFVFGPDFIAFVKDVVRKIKDRNTDEKNVQDLKKSVTDNEERDVRKERVDRLLNGRDS
jgi:hypothetical protein